MSSAMILAAGFGTRLRPLTLELPKPLVPVGDRPLLAHIAERCRAVGVTSLLANAHHEQAKFTIKIKELSLNIRVLVEPRILGTAGGVAGGRAWFEPGPVLVWNGDILTEPPLTELLELSRARDAQVLAVSPRPVGVGSVGLAEDGRVVRLRGRVFGPELRSADYVGVMALGPSVLQGLPTEGCLIADVALPLLERGTPVWTVTSLAPWSDLGDIESYVNENFRWLDAHVNEARASWCAPSARVAPGIELERCLLGADAEVSGAGELSEVIAWPGAPVVAPLSRAIVLGSGLVVPFGASATSAEN
jgi:mannose-1-phosphate guanylyltransferase